MFDADLNPTNLPCRTDIVAVPLEVLGYLLAGDAENKKVRIAIELHDFHATKPGDEGVFATPPPQDIPWVAEAISEFLSLVCARRRCRLISGSGSGGERRFISIFPFKRFGAR